MGADAEYNAARLRPGDSVKFAALDLSQQAAGLQDLMPEGPDVVIAGERRSQPLVLSLGSVPICNYHLTSMSHSKLAFWPHMQIFP